MPELSAAPDAADVATSHDDLGAALDAGYDKHVAPAADTAPVVDDAAPSSTEPAADTRARAPDGKFAKADTKPAAAPVDPAAAPKPEFRIPEKWPPQVKERLNSIHAVNPEHAQFVLEQYEHFRREAAQHSNRVEQRMKSFDDLLAPGRQARALQNMDDNTYVRNLIAAGDVLDKNPEQGLKWLAQRYGVDLQRLANPDAAGQEPAVPPEVVELRERLNRTEAYLQTLNQTAEQQQLAHAEGWINQFASQKDASGQLKYPYFDECLPEIVFNVKHQKETGQPFDVHAAYTRAVLMNDTVRLKDQTARSEAAKKADKARVQREIEDAKRAGFSVSGSGAASSADVPDDLGTHLDRNYDKFVRS